MHAHMCANAHETNESKVELPPVSLTVVATVLPGMKYNTSIPLYFRNELWVRTYILFLLFPLVSPMEGHSFWKAALFLPLL